MREAVQLKARAELTEASFPALPTDLEGILSKTLDDIAEDAQKTIAEHVNHHGMGEEGKSWIASGVDHVADDCCPFCGQPVQGIALVEAYRKVSAEGYRNLKAAVAQTSARVERDFGDRTGRITRDPLRDQSKRGRVLEPVCESRNARHQSSRPRPSRR